MEAYPRVPKETAMYDDTGQLSRPWLLFFQSGMRGKDGAAGKDGTLTITDDTSDLVTLNGELVTWEP